MKSILLSLLLSTAAIAQEPATETHSAPTDHLTLPSVTEPNPPIVNQFTPYVTLGLGPVPIPLPLFGVGARQQWHHHGIDLSLQATTLIEFTPVKASALYNYYFKPNPASQFYLGLGAGAGYVFGGWHGANWFASPELVLGKQYRNESKDTRFFQAQISFPTIGWSDEYDYKFNGHYHESHRTGKKEADVSWFPLVVFTYGIGF
jgi:hypothetical protein